MRKLLATCLLLLSASTNALLITSTGDPALAGATVETFNSHAQGYFSPIVFSGFQIQGIGSPMRILNDANAATFGISGNALQNYGGAPQSFDILFDDVVSAFGIYGGAYNDSWTFTAFDSSDNLIELQNVSAPCCDPAFFGIAATGISRVRVADGGDWVVFDNLHFVLDDSVEVPVPASVPLIVLGLAGLCWSRRKKT